MGDSAIDYGPAVPAPLLHRVRERVRPLVPRRLRTAANRAVFAAVGLAVRGHAVECACCGRTYRRFVRYPSEYCPGCGSYERQRLLCLFLDRSLDLVRGDVLHVGPEAGVMARYGPSAASWTAVDLDPGHPLADATMDVTALALPDASFDLVLCSHVLDVVSDHEAGVRELRRVTRPSGAVLVQAPRRGASASPATYAVRLRAAGFHVQPVLLPEQGDEAERRRLGLDADDPIFVCRPA